MLILSRKIEEGVRIGENIEIKILDVYATDNSGSRKSKVASIGISAPREISILRKELADTLETNRSAGEAKGVITGNDLALVMKSKRSLDVSDK